MENFSAFLQKHKYFFVKGTFFFSCLIVCLIDGPILANYNLFLYWCIGSRRDVERQSAGSGWRVGVDTRRVPEVSCDVLQKTFPHQERSESQISKKKRENISGGITEVNRMCRHPKHPKTKNYEKDILKMCKICLLKLWVHFSWGSSVKHRAQPGMQGHSTTSLFTNSPK